VEPPTCGTTWAPWERSAFRNFMHCAYNSAPQYVLMRFYAEFFVVARRDMGYKDSKITARDVLGIRTDDLYRLNFDEALSDPIELVCQRTGWTPPWQRESQRAEALDDGVSSTESR
jgi:hypothetical protein